MQKVVERFKMHQSKPVGTPLGQHMKLSKSQGPISDDDRKKMDVVPYTSGVGSIMYGMVCTRPDLAHAVSDRFMVEPGQAHWEALKWMLRYINGTLDSGLLYQMNP